MATQAHHPLSAVGVHEAEGRLVVRIELPDDVPRITTDLDDRTLIVTVGSPPEHRLWGHPDAPAD